MKIKFQTIPPQLVAAYKQLIANKPPDAGGSLIARTTKKARRKAPRRPTRSQVREIENAVDQLIQYLTLKDGHAPAKGFRAAQIKNLKRGIFDGQYWVKCKIESEQMYISMPTDVPWSGPRNYSYPDPTNQPTRATYPAGEPSDEPPHYFGMTIDGYFHDMSLKWRRTVFILDNKFFAADNEPAFLRITGTINGIASTRAARAMLSLIFKWWLVPAGSPRMTTTEPPTVKPRSAMWRYKVSQGVPPFYNLSLPVKKQFSARVLKYTDLIGEISRCVLLIAPMPMMGWRYNNNISVTTSITPTCELWQIKKAVITIISGTAYTAAMAVHAFRWENDVMTDLGTLGGTSSTPKSVSQDGKIIVGYAAITSGQQHAFRWEGGTMIDLGTFGGATSNANDVSANGLIVIGYAQDASSRNRAFRWENGTMTDLGTLGGNYAVATVISSDGTVIAGYSATAAGQQHAFRWEGGTMIDLGTLGGTTSSASAITPDGISIVGTSQTATLNDHAYRWAAGSMLDLGTLGGNSSFARCVSSDGTIVAGQSRNAAGQNHAFRWENGTMTDLGTLGGTTSDAVKMSTDGTVIVGTARNAAGQNRAFRWENGTMTDLGDFGGNYSAARSVSPDGSIVIGIARTPEGFDHAFSWANGVMTDLGTLGGPLSDAQIINR